MAGVERALGERVALEAHVRPGEGRDRVALAQVLLGQRHDARGRRPEAVRLRADLRRPREGARLGQRVAVGPVVEVAVRDVEGPRARAGQVGGAERGLVVPLVEGRRVGRGLGHVAPGVQEVAAVGVEGDPGGGREGGEEVALRGGLGLGEGGRPAVGLARGAPARADVVVAPLVAEVAVEVHAVHRLEPDAVAVVVARVLAPGPAAVRVEGLVVRVAVGVHHRAEVDDALVQQVAGELVGVVPRQQVVHEPEQRLHPLGLARVGQGVEEHRRPPVGALDLRGRAGGPRSAGPARSCPACPPGRRPGRACRRRRGSRASSSPRRASSSRPCCPSRRAGAPRGGTARPGAPRSAPAPARAAAARASSRAARSA